MSAALAAFDSDQLVVHTLRGGAANPLAGLPALGYVSPLASRGYPTLEATAGATAGLESPDGILGAAKIGGGVAVIYVEKQLNASTTNNCSSTPRWALTNIDTGHPRNANKDVVTIRDDDRRHQFQRRRPGERVTGPDHHRLQRHPLGLAAAAMIRKGIVTDRSRVTIVFAGYNTPQPSSNLGDYRAIARFQLRFPDDYVARPPHLDAD